MRREGLTDERILFLLTSLARPSSRTSFNGVYHSFSPSKHILQQIPYTLSGEMSSKSFIAIMSATLRCIAEIHKETRKFTNSYFRSVHQCRGMSLDVCKIVVWLVDVARSIGAVERAMRTGLTHHQDGRHTDLLIDVYHHYNLSNICQLKHDTAS